MIYETTTNIFAFFFNERCRGSLSPRERAGGEGEGAVRQPTAHKAACCNLQLTVHGWFTTFDQRPNMILLPAHSCSELHLTPPICCPSPVMTFLCAKHRQNFSRKGFAAFMAFLATAGSTLSGTPQGKNR
jgi:hypothetical protein